MNRDALVQEIEGDMRAARKVLYVEGSDDVDALKALLGSQPVEINPPFVDGVLIKPVNGKHNVKARLQIAESKGFSGLYGVTDGDGADWATIGLQLSSPTLRPHTIWPAYSIENLLLQAAWPDDWRFECRHAMSELSPYVAQNQLWRRHQDAFREAGLSGFDKPRPHEKLLTLSEAKTRLTGLLERPLAAELQAFEADYLHLLNQRSLDAAHCLLNGKWLVEYSAVTLTNQSKDTCRQQALRAAESAEGHPSVKMWWTQLLAASF